MDTRSSSPDAEPEVAVKASEKFSLKSQMKPATSSRTAKMAKTDDALPDGWTEHVDASTGQTYFWNAKMGKRSIERPKSGEDSPSHKIQVLFSDLTSDLQSFMKVELVDGCIEAKRITFLPIPGQKIKKSFVRKCYEDVYDLLNAGIRKGYKKFSISGTPGIGKTLFFVYTLFRIIDHKKENSCKPKRIIYQSGKEFTCFDLENEIVTEVLCPSTLLDEAGSDTLYVIDGSETSHTTFRFCVALFISSPRSGAFKEFNKDRSKKYYFPVFTRKELWNCSEKCYPSFPKDVFDARFRLYGGVARHVFSDCAELQNGKPYVKTIRKS